MKRLQIDILGVSETHWINETTKAFQKEQHVLIHSCRTDHIHQQGVGKILKEKLAKQPVVYDLINERVMTIQLKTAQEPLFVFQIYAPDSFYSPDLKDEFYSLLQQQINKLPMKSIKINMGDFYGNVGTNGIDIHPDNCGKYGVGRMNDEEERLQDLCAMNNLAVMNSVYKQRKNRLVTWICPDGRAKNQIDYILVPIDQKGLIKK